MTATDRDLILHNILLLVPFDGWTDYSFKQAVKRSGLDAATAKRVFPKGVDDCMDHFLAIQDALLAETFPEGSLCHLRVPERIETLLMRRFEHLLPYREAVRRAVAKSAMPWNAAQTTMALYRSVDLMWQLAGDASTNFNFYTKRMTLAGIYSSALLYWLDDTSEGNAGTRGFIHRRLQDAASFGKWKKDCKASLEKIFN